MNGEKIIFIEKNTGNSVANYTEVEIICSNCKGEGLIEIEQEDIECPDCNSKGYLIIRR